MLMSNVDIWGYVKLGNVVSVAAAVLILVVLFGVALMGLQAIFAQWALAIMWVLWLMGIVAYVFYASARLRVRALMVYAAPAALAITLIGLVLLTIHSFLGAELIVLGYFLEPIAGVSLYLTLLGIEGRLIKAATHVFFWGAVVFTVGLPIILVKDPYISIMGDLIKLIGLVILIMFK